MHKRLNRLLWCLDLSPTGERKRQRGYSIDTRCSCGQDAPTRTHILLQCPELAPERARTWHHIRATVRQQFTSATTATAIERQTVDEVRDEILAWLQGPNAAEDEVPANLELAEDLLCGLWQVSV